MTIAEQIERIDVALRLARRGFDSHGYRMRAKDIPAHIDRLLEARHDLGDRDLIEDDGPVIGERLDAGTIAALRAKFA